MRKDEAIKLVLERYPDAFIVSTCGHISRDLYNIQDRPEHFYMVGSMGMAAPIALGVALTHPKRPIVILDGDGSFLMNLGIVSMIGEHQPSNLIHVILDNGMHESTGGQKTVSLSNTTEFVGLMGYRFGKCISRPSDWMEAFPSIGPGLVHIKIEPRTEKIGKRVEWTPQEIVARFTAALGV